MSTVRWATVLWLWLCLGAGSGCAGPPVLPALAPQEKLVLRPSGDNIRRAQIEILAGGQIVARSPSFQGLANYVRCVPRAQAEAAKATRYGQAGRFLSYSGSGIFWASLGVGIVGTVLVPLIRHDCAVLRCYDALAPTNAMLIGVTLGKIMELLGSDYRGTAHGRAQNAINLYNDAVGTLGPQCEDRHDTP